MTDTLNNIEQLKKDMRLIGILLIIILALVWFYVGSTRSKEIDEPILKNQLMLRDNENGTWTVQIVRNDRDSKENATEMLKKFRDQLNLMIEHEK